MNKGLFLPCWSCGFTEYLDLNGNAAEVEAEINRVITIDGFRYVNAWDHFICNNCRTKGFDKYYEAYAGKPKPASKTVSYSVLVLWVKRQLAEFAWLDEVCP